MRSLESLFGMTASEIAQAVNGQIREKDAIAEAVVRLLPLSYGIRQTVFVPLASGKLAQVTVKVVDAVETEKAARERT